MLRNLWQLARDSLIYGLGRGILLPLGLITLPIFTRVFSPDSYGTIELISTLNGLLAMFLILGMDSAMARSYFDSPNQEHKAKVVSTGFWFLLAWNLLILGVLLLCSSWISSLIFGNTQDVNLLRLAFFIPSFSLLVAYCQNTIRLHFSPWKFTLVAFLNGIFTVGLSILFVLEFEMGLSGYFGGMLTGAAISLVPALYFIRKDLTLTFSLVRIKEMLSFGLPLVPASLAYYILVMSDRYFLNAFTTLDDVGLYSVSVKVTSLMLFFYMALSLSWIPFVYKIYSESEDILKELISKVAIFILLFFSLLAVAITTFAPELLHIITIEEYFGAAIAIAPLCLGAVAYASTQVTALGINLARKTKYIALFSWVAALVNLGLNALLIPNWGILGASIATALSFTVLTIGYYAMSQKLYPISFNKLAILKICLICIIFVVAGSFITLDNLILSVFAKLGFIALFIAIIFSVKVFDPYEITYFKKWLVGLKNVRSIADLRNLVKSQLGG